MYLEGIVEGVHSHSFAFVGLQAAQVPFARAQRRPPPARVPPGGEGAVGAALGARASAANATCLAFTYTTTSSTNATDPINAAAVATSTSDTSAPRIVRAATLLRRTRVILTLWNVHGNNSKRRRR